MSGTQSQDVHDVGGAGAGGADAGLCDRAGLLPPLWVRGECGYLVCGEIIRQ